MPILIFGWKAIVNSTVLAASPDSDIARNSSKWDLQAVVNKRIVYMLNVLLCPKIDILELICVISII